MRQDSPIIKPRTKKTWIRVNTEFDRSHWILSRPRLGMYVELRRHRIGSEVRLVVHDTKRDRRMLVGERELRALSCMDGTRDVTGIALASGLGRDRVAAFVRELHELGLFDEDDAPLGSSFARDLPVRALPGHGFDCDGSGACCELFDSVLFTPLDAARARAAAPDVLDAGHDPWRAFSPARGLDETLLAVARCDGACAYLREDRACGIYPHRPHGCRTFPMRHVDVGTEIRVAPRAECDCAFEPGTGPLTQASRGSELPRQTWVERPEGIDLTRSDGLELPETSVAEWCAAEAARLGAAPIDWGALSSRVERLMRDNAWRAERDRVRQGLTWMALALERDGEQPSDAAEALFVRASAFLGDLATGDMGATLRSWEARIRIARRMPAEASARVRTPLGLVNALARSLGLSIHAPAR